MMNVGFQGYGGSNADIAETSLLTRNGHLDSAQVRPARSRYDIDCDYRKLAPIR